MRTIFYALIAIGAYEMFCVWCNLKPNKISGAISAIAGLVGLAIAAVIGLE